MQVVVIPLPPPALEPPKVAVRIPKAVQERKAAAAAAREAKRLAAGAEVNLTWSVSCVVMPWMHSLACLSPS